MKFFHIHHDPNWELDGAWYHYQCKCGARKIRRAYSNIIGPAKPGWPSTVDRHGVFRDSSPWVRKPIGGWPVVSDVHFIKPPPRGKAAGA